MPPKIRDVLQQLKDAGWQQVGQIGSYRHFERSCLPRSRDSRRLAER